MDFLLTTCKKRLSKRRLHQTKIAPEVQERFQLMTCSRSKKLSLLLRKIFRATSPRRSRLIRRPSSTRFGGVSMRPVSVHLCYQARACGDTENKRSSSGCAYEFCFKGVQKIAAKAKMSAAADYASQGTPPWEFTSRSLPLLPNLIF
jgi:hypothetical protein